MKGKCEYQILLAVAFGILANINSIRSQNTIVCYYTSWSAYRSGAGSFTPADIDVNLCTHIIYSFAILDETTSLMKVQDPNLDLNRGYYKQVVQLKGKNKNLKVLLAIGGWTDSQPGDKYSALVSSQSKRSQFIRHAIQMLEDYGFDGLDLDWEYPKAKDKANFVTFVKEMKTRFSARGLLVTAAVSASSRVLDAGIDVKGLAQYLDQFHIMTYDFHGSWENTVNHHSPLYSTDILNTDAAVNYFLSHGAPANKLVVGIPTYGRSWTLADRSRTAIGSPATGAGAMGSYTKEGGILSYYEICSQKWTVNEDPELKRGPYAYDGNQWVGYDDPRIISKKCEYIKTKHLKGAMIWSLDNDDFKGQFCGQGRYPLLSAIKSSLFGTRGTNGPRGGGGGAGGGTGVTNGPHGGGGGGAGPTVKCHGNEIRIHPTDCTAFIQCVFGKSIVQRCPSGTAFNNRCKCCDWPANSDC